MPIETRSIDASGIRKVFALAADLDNPLNLSIGQPDYDVDDVIKERAITAIRDGFNQYTQTWGIDELRRGASDYYERRFGVGLDNVMITCGVSGGLYLALLATVNPGDEVIFGDPYFVMYEQLVKLLGGVAKPVDTYPDFKLKAADVEAGRHGQDQAPHRQQPLQSHRRDLVKAGVAGPRRRRQTAQSARRYRRHLRAVLLRRLARHHGRHAR